MVLLMLVAVLVRWLAARIWEAFIPLMPNRIEAPIAPRHLILFNRHAIWVEKYVCSDAVDVLDDIRKHAPLSTRFCNVAATMQNVWTMNTL
jgi:hypothetical protein